MVLAAAILLALLACKPVDPALPSTNEDAELCRIVREVHLKFIRSAESIELEQYLATISDSLNVVVDAIRRETPRDHGHLEIRTARCLLLNHPDVDSLTVSPTLTSIAVRNGNTGHWSNLILKPGSWSRSQE